MFSFINNNGDNNNDNKEPIREFYKNIYPNTSIYEIQQYVLELNNVFLYNHPNIQYEFIFKEPSKLSFFGLFGGGIGVNNDCPEHTNTIHGGDKSYIETLIMGTPDIKNKTTEPYVFFEDVLNKIFRIKNIPEEEKEQIAKETSIFYEKTTAPNESVGDWFKRIFYAPEPVPKPATTTPTSPPSSIFDVKPVVVLPPVPSIPLITEPTPATTTPTPTKITSIFGEIEPVAVGVGGPSKKEEEDIIMDASGTMFDITPISIPPTKKPTTEQQKEIEQIEPTPTQPITEIEQQIEPTPEQIPTEQQEQKDIEQIPTEQPTETQQELPYVLPEIPKKINKIIIQIYGEDTDKEEIEEIMKELYRVPIPFDDNTDNRDIYNTYSNKKIEIEKEMIGVEYELNIENIRGTKLYYALLRKHKKGKIVYV